MKIAYFDCFSGISGDMVLGALIDLGLDIAKLRTELDKLNLSGHYELETKKVEKQGIYGTEVNISLGKKDVGRKLEDILTIIDGSTLTDDVKQPAKKIFVRLAEAEANIHLKNVKEIYFHEVGGLDAIIDVVGAVIGVKLLGFDAVYASPLHVGCGFVKCRHGTLPVPAPATLELIKGVPIYGCHIDAELVTPTGAAIITTLAQSFGELPKMKVEKIGYGAGKRNLPIPNLLRVVAGIQNLDDKEYDEDTVTVIETNIDNMNPEFYEYVMTRLFENGAVDVFLTPIQMKQARPATLLAVIVAAENLRRVLEVIFSETTTLGVRTYEAKRYKLAREGIVVETEHGKIRVKLGKLKGAVVNFAPEYEDCRRVADEAHIPIKQVYEAAKQAAVKMTRERKIEDQRDIEQAQKR